MQALAEYDSSDGEGDTEQANPDIDPEKASEVLSRLKDKFPLNSAPYVPVRVSINWNHTALIIILLMLIHAT